MGGARPCRHRCHCRTGLVGQSPRLSVNSVRCFFFSTLRHVGAKSTCDAGAISSHHDIGPNLLEPFLRPEHKRSRRVFASGGHGAARIYLDPIFHTQPLCLSCRGRLHALHLRCDGILHGDVAQHGELLVCQRRTPTISPKEKQPDGTSQAEAGSREQPRVLPAERKANQRAQAAARAQCGWARTSC
jgi:hypothetical protein